MDKRLELAHALLAFGKQAELVAKLLLSDAIGELNDDTILTTLPITNKTIDVSTYQSWPDASHKQSAAHANASIINDLSDLSVIEYNNGPSQPISIHNNHARIDLVIDSYKFEQQPANVRIISSLAAAKNSYDIGVIWESLETCNEPLLVLSEMQQRCKRIIIRFRPWTSRDGAFQSQYFNKAYAHLLMDLNTQVKMKVVKPLATYEDMLSKLKLPVISRKINSLTVEEFFTDPDIINTIISRTWGALHKDEALKILTTSSIDYVVGS